MEHAIEVFVEVRAPFVAVRGAVEARPAVLLTEDAGADRSFRTTLRLDLGAGTSVDQDVAVEVDEPRPSSGTMVTVPVRWRPVGHAGLFPAFRGELQLVGGTGASALRLRGRYTVPLGVLGRAGDRLAGRTVARQVLRDQLTAAAARLERVATDVAPPEGLDRERDAHPEHFIG